MSEKRKTLVVYYSYSGNTRSVGQEIAKQLGADIEEIVDMEQKKGVAQFLSAGSRAATGQPTTIQKPAKNPADYDLVVIGGPVYAGNPPSPVLTYLTEQKPVLKRVAFFATSGSRQNAKALVRMGEILGKTPEATLGVPGADMRSGMFGEQVTTFCAKLKL